jgi:hypothetical protein
VGGPAQSISTAIKNAGATLPLPAGTLADLDTLAEHLRGRFVVQVVVDADAGHRRTNVYRSCAAAERAVLRALERGQTAHVTLVQMLPWVS